MKSVLRAGLALTAAWLCAACSHAPVFVNRGYNFRKVHRVAVVGFSDYGRRPGAGDLVAGVFEKYLLEAGYDVVERRQVSRLLQEQSFDASGAVDPAMAKQLGKLLGVDALVLGDITQFVPEHTLVAVAQPYGGRGWRRYPPPPPPYAQSVDTTAKVGITARMVDVESGSLLWSGSDSEEGDNVQDCADAASGAIMTALKSTWPARLKR